LVLILLKCGGSLLVAHHKYDIENSGLGLVKKNLIMIREMMN